MENNRTDRRIITNNCQYTERNITDRYIMEIGKPYFYGRSNYVKSKRTDHKSIWKINVKSRTVKLRNIEY